MLEGLKYYWTRPAHWLVECILKQTGRQRSPPIDCLMKTGEWACSQLTALQRKMEEARKSPDNRAEEVSVAEAEVTQDYWSLWRRGAHFSVAMG